MASYDSINSVQNILVQAHELVNCISVYVCRQFYFSNIFRSLDNYEFTTIFNVL